MLQYIVNHCSDQLALIIFSSQTFLQVNIMQQHSQCNQTKDRADKMRDEKDITNGNECSHTATWKHSFHGAAIFEVGCGGARTWCAHPAGARTEALVRY